MTFGSSAEIHTTAHVPRGHSSLDSTLLGLYLARKVLGGTVLCHQHCCFHLPKERLEGFYWLRPLYISAPLGMAGLGEGTAALCATIRCDASAQSSHKGSEYSVSKTTKGNASLQLLGPASVSPRNPEELFNTC